MIEAATPHRKMPIRPTLVTPKRSRIIPDGICRIA